MRRKTSFFSVLGDWQQDEQRVEVIRPAFNGAGKWTYETNSYVQLASGLNYWSEETRSWEPSIEEIVIAQRGAVALRGQQKVIFAPTLDDPEGSIDVLTMDGQRLRSAILALGYYDPIKTGQRVTFALVKDAHGELLPPNQVIYRDAFESTNPDLPVSVDVVYTYRLSGLAQELVFRSVPPDPESFGIPGEFARLEIFTEFYEAPSPRRHRKLLATVEDEEIRRLVVDPDWVDETLDFGHLWIPDGRAFRLGQNHITLPDDPRTAVVAKSWVEQEGRTMLIESLDYLELLPLLVQELRDAGLEANAGTRKGNRSRWSDRVHAAVKSGTRRDPRPASSLLLLPERRLALREQTGGPLKLAQRTERIPGVAIDYLTLNTMTNGYTFRCDETYYIPDRVDISGPTRLEGGTVIKYGLQSPATPQITVMGPFICATEPYRPAIFTAKDDDSVGEAIVGSTGSPSPSVTYAQHGIWFKPNDPSGVLLEHFRFRYASHAVLVEGRPGTVRHAQFQHCTHPIYGWASSPLRAQNILAVDMRTAGAVFKPAGGTELTGEHLTVCNSPNLVWTNIAYPNGPVTLRNSILAAVTTLQPFVGQGVPEYGNHITAISSGLFQTVGAGAYYLAPGSPHRDVAVAIPDAALARELRAMTTYAPLVHGSDFVTDTVLWPQAARDANLPDRGYHYVPLDYCLSSLNLTNCTLVLTNGVAIGIYGPKGLTLRRGAKLVSEGTPTALNRIVRYNTVQEQTLNWGSAPSGSFTMVEANSSGTPVPSARFQFTEVSHLAVSTNTTTARRFLWAGSGSVLDPLALSHCQLRGVNLDVTYAAGGNQTVALTNNLFEGSIASFFDLSGYNTYTLSAYNNLFHRGKITFDNQDSLSSWVIRDNLFDVDAVTAAGYFTASHNGFRSGLSSFGSNNKTGLAPDYVRGPLGGFYIPRTGSASSLTNLVDTGSRTAAAAALYHFTTRSDQTKEAATTVDIGFHYAATGPVLQGLLGHWRFDESSGTQAADSSANGFHGTLLNGPIWTYGVVGNGVSLDGVNDYVSVPSAAALQPTTAYSIAFWYQKFAERTGWVRVVGKGNSSFRNYGVWDDSGATRRLLFQYQNTGGAWQQVYSVAATTTNQWYHVACTWDGATGRIYIDGKLDASGPMSGTPKTSSDPVTFGYSGWDSLLLGILDEVSIYNRVLNPAEVVSLMQGTAVDTDGDGSPDYLEDRNGDGSSVGDPTSWQAYNSPNGLTGNPGLQIHTPLKP